MKIRRLKKAKTTLILPDMHLPFANWKGIQKAHRWAEKHNPDAVIQLGDLLDQKCWSRWPKDADDFSPAQEFEESYKDCEKLEKYFPNMEILIGNHDVRYIAKAAESSLPKQMIKTLDELFPMEGWRWSTDPDEFLLMPTVRGDVMFMHGDEMGGRPLSKATSLGVNVIQGHTHQSSVQYQQSLDKFLFGAEAGHLMDVNSKGARYAARNPKGTACGFMVMKFGVVYFIPADGSKV